MTWSPVLRSPIRAALWCCAILLVGFAGWASAADSGTWTVPVGTQDPEGRWAAPAASYDASWSTYASDQSNRAGPGAWLVQTLAGPTRTDRVQVVADFGYGIVDAVSIDAQINGMWTPMYLGAVLNDAPTVIAFPEIEATAFRFRFEYLAGGYYFWLYDWQVFALPAAVAPPQVTTTAATSVGPASAVLHGILIEDGGTPCAVRFQYWHSAGGDVLDTPWQAEVTEGRTVNAVLGGLLSGGTYGYRLQARNGAGLVTGPDLTFRTGSVCPGPSERWIAASGIVPPAASSMSWVDAERIIDDDPLTLATCYHPLWEALDSPVLELVLPDADIDAVRFLAGRNAYIAAATVWLQTAGTDTWEQVHSGAFTDRTWLTVPLGTVRRYTKARVGFTVTTTGVGTNWELGEFQVRVPAAPPVTVGFASPAATVGLHSGRRYILLTMDPPGFAQDVEVGISMAGTAVRGLDYDLVGVSGDPGTFTIPAGDRAPRIELRLLRTAIAGTAADITLSPRGGSAVGPHTTLHLDFTQPILIGPLPTPVFSPPAGTYAGAVLATVSGSNAFRYTLDGTAPTLASPLVTGPIAITASATLTVQVLAADEHDGIVYEYGQDPASAAYTITPISGAWRAPTTTVDPEGRWVDEPLAFDGSQATYAADQSNRAGAGPWLELHYPEAFLTDRVRVVSDFGLGIVDAVEIEALSAGVWTPVHAGAIANVAPSVVSFPPLTVSAFRFRYIYRTAGYYFWLYEFAAYAAVEGQIADPTVATLPASSVTAYTAALHGSLVADGGRPCEVRFQYREAAATAWQETPWQSGLTTAQGASAVLTQVANLQSDVSYVYRVQARNVDTIVSGAEVAFRPTALEPTASEQWISSGDAVGGTTAAMAWQNPLHAIDDDPQTLATCYHPLWEPVTSPAIEFALPGLATDTVRLYAGRNPYIGSVTIALLPVDGTAWVQVYSGTFSDRTWLTVPLGSLAPYSRARVTFTVTTTAVGTAWELGEFQVRIPTLAELQLPAPVITPAGGPVGFPLAVSVSSSAPMGVDLRYTTTGSVPSEASPLYAAPLMIDSPRTVRAKAFRAGWWPSPETAVVFTAQPANHAPVIAACTVAPWTGGLTSTAQVEATDIDSPTGLTYTWSVTPADGLTLASSGATAALTATRIGTWTIRVTVSDPLGASATSQVETTVVAVPTAMNVSPVTAAVVVGGTVAFNVAVTDQFGGAWTGLAPAWSVSGGGSITSTGVFTAGSPGVPFTISASLDGLVRTALVGVVSPGWPAAPVITPEAGTRTAAFTAALAGDAGTVIRYRTDGAAVTEADPAATTVEVDRSMTLMARAFGCVL